MKIAMIGQRGIPARYGGVERHVAVLSEQLARMGHEVTVYTRRWYADQSGKPSKFCHAGRLDPASSKFLDSRFRGNDTLRITRKILPSLHTQYLDTFTHTFFSAIHAVLQDFDVIHFHGVGPALLAWIPRVFKPRARVIVTVHSLNRLHPQWNVFGKLILLIGEWAAVHFPHRTIAVSHHLRTYFRQQYGCDVVMIPNGIELPATIPSRSFLDRWHLVAQQYVLFVGRFVESKGAHTLIAAWKEVQKKRPDVLGDRKLALVGDAHFDDAYGARLRKLAGRDASIVFTGWMEGEALRSVIAHAGVFAQPSATEGLPIALLEAMAYGIPALVSDIPAHRELIAESAVRFPVDDYRALARLMIEAFTDPAWYEQQGARNREVVKRNYKWEVVAKKTVEVYKK